MLLTERIDFRMLKVGSCRHLECIAFRSGRLRNIEFPSLCALLRHPAMGWMLHDTGYSEHFYTATRFPPGRLYRIATPVELPQSECLLTQLGELGIEASDISHVLISHFHGDHVAGLRDFPVSTFLSLRGDWNQVRHVSSWRGVLDGFLPSLLPQDFEKRLQFVDERKVVGLPSWLLPLTRGYDLFGDGSLIAVPLPGHSRSQMGLVIRDQTDRIRFLAADACWSLPACRDGELPSRLTHFLLTHKADYARTFKAVQAISLREPAISILPSHCSQSWQAWKNEDA